MSYSFNSIISVKDIVILLSNFVHIHSATLEEEIFNTKCDINVKSIASNSEKFWTLLNKDIQMLGKVAVYIKPFLRSTYLYKSTFSSTIVVKTKHRSPLSDLQLLMLKD